MPCKHNAGSMLGRRVRRRPSIEPAMNQYLICWVSQQNDQSNPLRPAATLIHQCPGDSYHWL